MRPCDLSGIVSSFEYQGDKLANELIKFQKKLALNGFTPEGATEIILALIRKGFSEPGNEQ